MKNVISFLSNKYSSMLQPSSGYTLNHCFLGYSYYFKKDIFIKIYNNEKRYNTEKIILENTDKSRILASLSVNKYFVNILEDRDYSDVDDFSSEVSYEAGVLLAKYHKANNNLKEEIKIIRNEDSILENINNFLMNLKDYPKIEKLREIYDTLFIFRDLITTEYKSLDKVVMHGDFGLRNIKYLNGRLTLIDFESSKVGLAYRDVIKFYAIDCNNSNLKEAFSKGYKSISPLTIPSPLLKQVLLFYTALEVYNFTIKVNDKSFRNVADDLIVRVEIYLKEEEKKLLDELLNL